MKDDAALNDYLVSSAVDNAELTYSAGCTRRFPAKRWTSCCATTRHALDQIERWRHRFDATMLTALLEHAPVEPALWTRCHRHAGLVGWH